MRDLVLYVTVDEEYYFRPGDSRSQGHVPNLTRLREIAASCDLQVEPIYMDDLTEERLADNRLLALFGAGSFPEWFQQASDAPWKARLDRYAARLRTLRVPMLAVCGSHQLVAAAFHGWDAVAHMMPEGVPPITVEDELAAGHIQIPRPRPGEVGVFPLRRSPSFTSPDPILEGLPEQLWFVQYHRDYVLPNRHIAFTSLLEPDPVRTPTFWLPTNEHHHNPTTPAEFCPVQLLRLNDPTRLLYTTQFHPELPSGDPEVDAIRERLLRNFFRLSGGVRS